MMLRAYANSKGKTLGNIQVMGPKMDGDKVIQDISNTH